jgi:hypothetical protein
MLRKRDLLWLLALPIYQTVGTVRHEGGHALMAMMEGARVKRFVFLPSIREGRGILWGYVRYDGDTTWLTTAAPYFLDLLTFALLFGLCMYARRLPRWVWLNLVILGIVSPLVNSLYNYLGGILRPGNDVARLLAALPNWSVHLYFILTLSSYVAGLVFAFKFSRMAGTERAPH